MSVIQALFASASVTDPYWTNVVSLMHYDGANGSTTFTDQKPRTWTRFGSAQLSTAQSKFGGSSYTPFAASSSIQSSFSAAIGATQDFTIEFWLRTTQNTTGKTIFDIRTSAAQRGLLITQPGTDPASLNFYCGNSDGTAFEVSLNSGAASLANNTWYHVAATRQGDTFRLFLNGNLAASTTSAALSIDFGPTISFGNNVGNSSTVWFEGYLDELRITAGVCRYTASFTPPTMPFPSW